LPQLRFLEPHEVERLLTVPKLKSVTGMRNRCIMQLLWETGMRVGEVQARICGSPLNKTCIVISCAGR